MFKNKQNRLIKDNDRHHWISRSSVAICLVVCKNKVLIVKRGKSVKCSGKWCLPCGYLDYNESIEECAIREIYEESGIDVRKYKNTIKLDSINSDPSFTKNQDIGFNFIIEINSDNLPPINMDIVDHNETTDANWIDIHEISNYEFTFNHDIRITKHFENEKY